MDQDQHDGPLPAGQAADDFGAIAADLRQLRAAAGHPSFSELVRSIGRLRQDRGVAAEVSRPGRTTVYDAFRPGRRRIDADLVADIVLALGGTEPEAQRWRERCHAARGGAAAAHVVQTPLEPAAEPHTPAEPKPADTVLGRWLPGRPTLVVLVVAVVLNLLGRILVDTLQMSLHLDMVGTALAAVVLGPWQAVVVAIASSVLGMTVNGTVSLAFLPVNVVGGLIWGYGVHRLGLGRSVLRFFALTVVTAVACTLVAVPILLMLGGSVGHAGEDRLLEMLSHPLRYVPAAVLLSNLLLSLADKLISGFCALAVMEASPTRGPGARTA